MRGEFERYKVEWSGSEQFIRAFASEVSIGFASLSSLCYSSTRLAKATLLQQELKQWLSTWTGRFQDAVSKGTISV